MRYQRRSCGISWGEQGAGAEEPGAGETPLFLPTSDFISSAGEG